MTQTPLKHLTLKDLAALNLAINKVGNDAAVADLIARAAFDSADILTLSAQGTVTFNFAFAYDQIPLLRYMVFQPVGNQPVLIEAVEWVKNAQGKFTGVKLQGYRGQRMGNAPQVGNGAAISALATGMNGLANFVSGFNPFGGTGFAGVEVHISARIRIMPTT